jgi:hypothetical protein
MIASHSQRKWIFLKDNFGLGNLNLGKLSLGKLSLGKLDLDCPDLLEIRVFNVFGFDGSN